MKGKKIIASTLLGFTLIGCTGVENLGNNKTTGAAVGAATGALLGQLIGKDTKGTLIGAGVGALAGLGWGAYRDQQEAELKARLKNTEVKVGRDGEYINLNLPEGVTFATNSSDIVSNFYRPLNEISKVLIQYSETKILVKGYTDSTGNLVHNQKLSEARASSVKDYLVSQGVASNRIVSTGYGPKNPIASNATIDGRQANRRVEIKILPLY